MLFTRNLCGFSPYAVKTIRLRLALFAQALLALSPMSTYAHERANELEVEQGQLPSGAGAVWGSHHTEENPVVVAEGFECTQSGGYVLRCTNLGAGCARWWPGCTKRIPRWPETFPKECEKPTYRVVRIPVENSEVFLSQQTYSQNNVKQNVYSQSISLNGDLQGNQSGSNSNGNDPGSTGSPSSAPTQNQGGTTGANSQNSAQKTDPAFNGGEGSRPASAKGIAAAAANARGSFAPLGSESAKMGGKDDKGNDGAKNAGESVYQAYLAGKFSKGSKALEFSASPGNLPENEAVTKKHDSYSDPWLDYVSASSREELVDKLTKNAKLREELQRKLNNIAEGSGASEQILLEKREYFRKALAEAQSRLRRGTLQELAPMDEREAFSMNSDDTDREIKRLLASMDEKAADMSDKDDGLHYPLFPRVHRALWRQLGNGNIHLKTKPH